MRMAQEFGVAAGPVRIGLRLGAGVRGGAPCGMGLARPRQQRVEAAERIEQAPMGRRVQQPALIELSLDLEQGVAEPPQQVHAHGLVVHVGAGAAVRPDDAAQGDGLVRDQVVFTQ